MKGGKEEGERKRNRLREGRRRRRRDGKRKREPGLVVVGGRGGGRRGEIRDEKACLRWRKYSRGSEAPALFLKSDGAH